MLSRFKPFSSLLARSSSFGKISLRAESKVSSALHRFIKDKIRSGGPITVHEYMRMCTGSVAGYYNQQTEDFGKDFVTAPELCSVFGEMIGLWVYNELLNTGHQADFRLVELGPGSGVLMRDILRVLDKLQVKTASIHLIEVSKKLREKQRENLAAPPEDVHSSSKSRTASGLPISWHDTLDELPNDRFSIFVANEFFDVLPIHQFRRDSKGQWLEVYIDLDPDGQQLRFALPRNENVHTRNLLPKYVRDDPNLQQWEVSPETALTMHKIVERFSAHGGFALAIDYGHDGSRSTPSLRAYKSHQQVEVLDSPGEVDLTADVNFGHLKMELAEKCLMFGPVEQRKFLSELGIEHRVKRLLVHCQSETERNSLLSSVKLIMGGDEENGMGAAFKVVGLFPSTLKSILDERGGAPTGFLSTVSD